MRAANLYFLAVVLMQTIPGLSPTPWQATALPLVFVLTVNAIKVSTPSSAIQAACMYMMQTQCSHIITTHGNWAMVQIAVIQSSKYPAMDDNIQRLTHSWYPKYVDALQTSCLDQLQKSDPAVMMQLLWCSLSQLDRISQDSTLCRKLVRR